jgi:hypothetical protein
MRSGNSEHQNEKPEHQKQQPRALKEKTKTREAAI